MSKRLRIAAGLVALVALLIFTIACDPNREKLERFCAGKFVPDSYLYNECVDEGWKDWYANAEWMR